MCDFFWTEAGKYPTPEAIPPAISGQNFVVYSVIHNASKLMNASTGLASAAAAVKSSTPSQRTAPLPSTHAAFKGAPRIYFLAVCALEAPAIIAIEFLRRVIAAFEDYFGIGFTEADLVDEFPRVYQLLEEVADGGYPAQTEPAILRQLVVAPSFLGSIISKQEINAELPLSTLTNTPWRQVGVKHTQNDVYFDIVEDIDAVMTASGGTVSCFVNGTILANVQLSGTPDIQVNFANPSLISDVAFHPCVRLYRWDQSRVVSFVPPDGRFELMRYRVRNGVIPPLDVTPNITFSETEGKLDLSLTTKHFPGEKTFADDIVIRIPMPSAVTGVILVASQGSFVFDTKTRIVTWSVGKWLFGSKPATLTGSMTLSANCGKVDARPVVEALFRVHMYTASGIRVDSVNVQERYKTYKGVRCVTRAGHYYIRT